MLAIAVKRHSQLDVVRRIDKRSTIFRTGIYFARIDLDAAWFRQHFSLYALKQVGLGLSKSMDIELLIPIARLMTCTMISIRRHSRLPATRVLPTMIDSTTCRPNTTGEQMTGAWIVDIDRHSLSCSCALQSVGPTALVVGKVQMRDR